MHLNLFHYREMKWELLWIFSRGGSMDPGSEIENEEGLGLIHWSPAEIFFTWTTSLKILDFPPVHGGGYYLCTWVL